MFKKKPKLSEEDYVKLDVLMLMLRDFGKSSKDLEVFLRPLCMAWAEEYYEDRELPDGSVKQMPVGDPRLADENGISTMGGKMTPSVMNRLASYEGELH